MNSNLNDSWLVNSELHHYSYGWQEGHGSNFEWCYHITCKGNLTIEHNTQILARGIQSILDKYNTAEGCIPCKGDPKRKL